jgi:atypical dual specificity phosphatase
LLTKIGNAFRWIYGHVTGKTSNFNWIVKDKLAGSAIPTSLREIRWLYDKHGIKSIVTIKEKRLPSKWLEVPKIEYLHLSIEDYGAPSVEELDYLVTHIQRHIDHGKPVMVHCSGGKGRTGTTLVGYLLKVQDVLNAEEAIHRLKYPRRINTVKRTKRYCL